MTHLCISRFDWKLQTHTRQVKVVYSIGHFCGLHDRMALDTHKPHHARVPCTLTVSTKLCQTCTKYSWKFSLSSIGIMNSILLLIHNTHSRICSACKWKHVEAFVNILQNKIKSKQHMTMTSLWSRKNCSPIVLSCWPRKSMNHNEFDVKHNQKTFYSFCVVSFHFENSTNTF